MLVSLGRSLWTGCGGCCKHVNAVEWADLAIKAAGLVVLIIGLLQLHETVRRRHIDLYWQIADRYLSEEGRSSRVAIAHIEEALGLSGRSPTDELSNDEVISLAKTYVEKFHDKPRKSDEKKTDGEARYRLRLLNQAGLLLRKKLVDQDLLFGLLAPGLQVDLNTLRVIEHAYDTEHNFRVYPEFSFLVAKYHAWAASHPPPSLYASAREATGGE
jgi:hypothetical protein